MSHGRPVGPQLTARTARRIVLVGIAVLTAGRLVYAGLLPVAPQEAYYWDYAVHPALCYLDHPPMVAWWIHAGTALLGHHRLGLRLLGVLSSGLLLWILYRLGERLFSPFAGLLAASLLSAQVLFTLGAVVITPDVPLALFWAATLLVACDVLLEKGRGPGRMAWRWYLLGLLAGGACLSKYTAALLPLSLLAAALWLPRGRRALRTPHPWLAAALCLAVFSPVLVWNAEHHFASFAFQTARRAGNAGHFNPALLLQYLGLQAGAVTPVIYGALVWAVVAGWRRARRGDEAHRLLLLASGPGLSVFTLASLFMWVKLNWVGPVYFGALVALAGLLAARWDRVALRRTVLGGIALGAALCVTAMLLPFVPALPFPPKANVLTGYDTISAVVAKDLRRMHPGTFVIAWDYKTAAELAWHLPNGGAVVTCRNALGGRGRSFTGWFHPKVAHGHIAVVVTDHRAGPMEAWARHQALMPYCTSFWPLGPVTVRRGGQVVTEFHLLRCNHYHQPPGAKGEPGHST